MSLTIDHVWLSGCNFKVDLDKLPDLSDKVRGYFHKISSLRRLIPLLPPRCHFEPGLRKKIKKIDQVVRMANETKGTCCQKKAISLIKTAIVVFSLAFTIKFATTGDENDYWMITLASVCYMYFATSFYNTAKEKIEEVEALRPSLSRRTHSGCPSSGDVVSCCDRVIPVLIPSFLGMGMVLPLYEEQTRKHRLERVLKELRESINQPLERLKKENKAILVKVYEEYRGHLKTIETGVKSEAEALIEVFTKNSKGTDRLHISNLRLSIDACYEILEKLAEMDRFYQRVAMRITDGQSEEFKNENRENEPLLISNSDELNFSDQPGKQDFRVYVELQAPLLNLENYMEEGS